MWIPKWKRDRKKNVDSPFPTQAVSNEEFIPRPQTAKQAEFEQLVGRLADEKSKKLGMDRRDFLRTSRGLATAFLASNMVYGRDYWDVVEAETMEEAAIKERFPQDYFVMDVQAHFTNGIPLNFRNEEFIRNMGFQLENSPESYSFRNFVKEMFLESETDVLVISGVPGKEYDRALDYPATLRSGLPEDRQLVGEERTRGSLTNRLLPSYIMAQRRDEINAAARSRRALAQGNCAPNHYWDHANNRPDFAKLFDQIEREVTEYKIDSWKWYCHTDPDGSGNGFRLDDENMAYRFYEKSKEMGLRRFSVHKGYSGQSRTLGHLAHPGDIEKAALDHPDITFIIYHSALQMSPPELVQEGLYDPTTGDFAWHADLMRIKERNPQLTNVFPELGSAFNTAAVMHPEMAMHLMGRNIKFFGADHVIWGTDCLWWGSPQWGIDALKRFQISDELCERFGYAKITEEDKRLIFGLNAARIYGVDVNEQRNSVPPDAFSMWKEQYEQLEYPMAFRSNAAHGWVRDDTRG
jgi:predicted TIM-barrel fold metal-dependent hydrolase